MCFLYYHDLVEVLSGTCLITVIKLAHINLHSLQLRFPRASEFWNSAGNLTKAFYEVTPRSTLELGKNLKNAFFSEFCRLY